MNELFRHISSLRRKFDDLGWDVWITEVKYNPTPPEEWYPFENQYVVQTAAHFRELDNICWATNQYLPNIPNGERLDHVHYSMLFSLLPIAQRVTEAWERTQ